MPSLGSIIAENTFLLCSLPLSCGGVLCLPKKLYDDFVCQLNLLSASLIYNLRTGFRNITLIHLMFYINMLYIVTLSMF